MTLVTRPSVGSALRFLALAGALAMLFALVPLQGQANAQVGTIERYEGDGLVPAIRFRGAQRFDTARLIATSEWGTSGTVLVARGDLFPDSLAGNYLAGQLGAPLLLTATNQLVNDTLQGLRSLNARRVVLLGGTQAISTAVESRFRSEGFTVDRIGGIDRYATAAMIATQSGTTPGSYNGQRAAIVASGDNFPDALVAGSIAYAERLPLLLTNTASLNARTRQALESLQIRQVIVPGGTRAVNESVLDAMRAMGITVTRVSIQDGTRVDTAVALARFAVANFGFNLTQVGIARGDDFADALTIGPRQGRREQVLLLTNTPTQFDSDRQSNTNFLRTDAGCRVRSLAFAGGFAAISQAVQTQARTAATVPGQACDVTLTPQTAVNPVGETHTVAVQLVNNAGGPVTSAVQPQTITVNIAATDGTSQTNTARPVFAPAANQTVTATSATSQTATVQTSETGTARISFNSLTPGTVTVTASFTNAAGQTETATATKVYRAGSGALLTPQGAVTLNPNQGSGTPAAGATPTTSGTAAVTVETVTVGSTATKRVCVGINVSGATVDVTRFHVHRMDNDANVLAFERSNNFTATSATRDGQLAFCTTDLRRLQGGNAVAAGAAEIELLRTNPEQFYVDVHGEAQPTLAIVAGQLQRF